MPDNDYLAGLPGYSATGEWIGIPRKRGKPLPPAISPEEAPIGLRYPPPKLPPVPSGQRVEDWRLRQAAGEEIFVPGISSEEHGYLIGAEDMLADRIRRGVPVSKGDVSHLGNLVYIDEEGVERQIIPSEGAIWDTETATLVLEALQNQISQYGIQPHSLFYNEIVAIPAQEKAITDREIITRLQERWARESAEELRVKGQEARTEFQLAGVKENQQVWNEFNARKRQVLASGMSYDEKKGQLQNLVNELNTKVPLDELALYNLQLGARNDAFASLSPQEQTEVRTRVETGRGAMIEAGRVTPVTQPRFDIGFEQARPTTGPQYWRDWFRSQYSRELAQFRATTELEGLGAEQVEESWADFLRRRKPQLREQFQRQTPFQRGERPSVFAPKIKRVGF